MQRKYLMASHGHLASGMQSSINILAGKGEELKVIDAYVTEEDYTPQITAFLDSLQENEQGVIFTDFYGGSVNQKVATEVVKSGKENVFVLANANLPLVLAVMLSPEEELTAETLKAMTAEAAPQLVPLVPEKKESAEEELDDFF
ncbi:PTS mannose transporter subunit IIA [Mitsuokella sp. AF33-22]|uniref:PTS sugar transporter subunit IIA n=1 Tax=Mitsuokella sp. AF33-22 TaxID=2292047 RepID=UPI000E4AD270|nr:PTS sugar transporter subunit IIA [Mitsuokella sp. AF33-22]RHM57071.1 PTS mannose transporter subunit IIA [Mitsuokella sp. AF33-22]